MSLIDIVSVVISSIVRVVGLDNIIDIVSVVISSIVGVVGLDNTIDIVSVVIKNTAAASVILATHSIMSQL